MRAAALNFADVLKATGLFPDAPFGMECAGVVVRVGQCVRAFQPGDAVVAMAPAVSVRMSCARCASSHPNLRLSVLRKLRHCLRPS